MTGSVVMQETLSDLRSRVRGQVLTPADAGYDEARKIYNAMIDRRPAVIVRCAGCADVIQAVGVARERDCLVAVRGGGHNVAGNALCDDGLVIDLTGMRGVHVDPARQTARAEGGATWGDFDCETQAFGLATTGGLISSTGIAGLTLGGGLGWLMRKHGLACDNLLSVDLITAEGKRIKASAAENPDLYWGVRGGGGNFGVATSFEYRIHPVGPVLGGLAFYPLAAARQLLRAYRDFQATAPDEVTVYGAVMFLPEVGPVAALAACHHAPESGGEALLRPLRNAAEPLIDDIRLRPYRDMQTIFDAAFPSGLQNYWKSHFLKAVTDEGIDIAIEAIRNSPSPLNAIVFEGLGGAMARFGELDTAFAHRKAAAHLGIFGRWTDPADAEKNSQWTREFWSAMDPWSTGGVYVNAIGQEGLEPVKSSAYGSATYRRLAELKRRYDPDNFFRVNQNILPAAA